MTPKRVSSEAEESAELQALLSQGIFSPCRRDKLYSLLGIRRAVDIDTRIAGPGTGDSWPKISASIKQLARGWVPPLFPSDQRYLRYFEGLEAESVTGLRHQLGYIHYHTRDSVLGRLRGSLFQSILFYLETVDPTEWGNTRTTIGFLKNIVSRNIKNWMEKIVGVLQFSLHEDLDDNSQHMHAERILKDLLSWFLDDPDRFLSNPTDESSWIGSIRRGESTSLASSTFERPFPNLLLLRDGPSAGADTSYYDLLIDSSWYRYFFFDRTSLESWIKRGSTGFENEDVFEDFVNRLESQDNWETVRLPGGLETDDATIVRNARELGSYRVRLLSGEEIAVDVTLIATLSLQDMSGFRENGFVMIAKNLAILVFGNSQARVAVIGRKPDRTIGTVELYRWRATQIGVARFPGPGDYFARVEEDIARTEIGVSIAGSQEPSVHLRFDPRSKTIEIEVAIDSPSPDNREQAIAEGVRITCGSTTSSAHWRSRTDQEDGRTHLIAVTSIGFRTSTVGSTIAIESPLFSRPVVVPIPSCGILRTSNEPSSLIASLAEVVARRNDSFSLLARSPLRVRVEGIPNPVVIEDNSTQALEALGSKISIGLSEPFANVTIHDTGPRYVRRIEFNSHGETVALIRKSPINLSIQPQIGSEGSVTVVPAGSSIEVLLDGERDTPLTASLSIYAAGRPGRTLIEIVTPARVEIPKDLTSSSKIFIEVSGADIQSQKYTLIPVGPFNYDLPEVLECRAWTKPVRLRSDTPFTIVEVSGDILEFRREPSDIMPHKEFLVWIRPKRTLTASCRVRFGYRYSGLAAAAGVVDLHLEIPTFWFDIRYGDTKVLDEIQDFAGYPIYAILRTSDSKLRGFARVDTIQVEIGRYASSPSNLTSLLGLESIHETVKISFLVSRDQAAPEAVSQGIRVSPFYSPTVILPDGREWRVGGNYALLVRDFRPGTRVRLHYKDDGTSEFLSVDEGIGILSPKRLPVDLGICTTDGQPISAVIDGDTREVSIMQASSESPLRAFAKELAPGAGSEIREVARPTSKTELVDLASRSLGICVEVRSFLDGVSVAAEVRRMGWVVSLPVEVQSFADRLFAIGDNLSLSGGGPLGKAKVLNVISPLSEPLRDPRSDGAGSLNQEGRVVLLDSRLADSWRELLASNTRPSLIVLTPLISVNQSESKDAAIGILGRALRDGVVHDPTNFAEYRTALSAEDIRTLGAAIHQTGVDDLVARAFVEALKAPNTLRSKAACENLNAVLLSQGFAARIQPERIAQIRGTLDATLLALKQIPENAIREAVENFRTLTRNCPPQFWDLNIDPARPIIELEYGRLIADCSCENWESAVGRLRHLLGICPADSDLAWDFVCAALEASDRKHTPELRREAIRLAMRLSVENQGASGPSRFLKKRADRTLKQLRRGFYCECGEFLFQTRPNCPNCGKPNPLYR